MSSFNEVLAGLQTISVWQAQVYKQLHAHPELSFQESETAALAASKLKELVYEVLEGIGRTGIVGVLRNGEGQTVLARADIPQVLRSDLYAVAALAGAVTVVMGHQLNVAPTLAAILGAVICLGLRLFAIQRRWQLPVARAVSEEK